jgi:Excalibur calcium-binding domain
MFPAVPRWQREDGMEFRRCGRTAAGVTLIVLLSACQSQGLAAPTTTTVATSTSAVAIPTDLVGKSVPVAKEELAKLGYQRVDVVSVDGRMVIVESNWQVVSVDGAGSAKVTLHVAKPTPTPTPVPTTTTQAPPQTTEEAPPPPAYNPPAPDPGPTEVYYKNCTEARNAGAAPLHRGQPGYRAALDRDGDGIACE